MENWTTEIKAIVKTYRSDPAAVAGLIRPGQVHSDVYLSDEIFSLEQERLFATAWQYLGHASQVPEVGDFFTANIAGQPLMMVRQPDATVRGLINRCAHKGAELLSQRCGNTGKVLRCPYHAWTYRLDGSLLSMPLRFEYDNSAVLECEAGKGLGQPLIANYRGFIFVRLAPDGLSFEDYAGAMLGVLDNLVDRSPVGELTVMGGCIRSVIHCNWKMYLENVNDSIHAMFTHESVTTATTTVWEAEPNKSQIPLAVEQLLPFGSSLNFMRSMGARVLENGHSIAGTKASLHTNHSLADEQMAALTAVHGIDRAKEILSFTPQNAIVYPTLALKCSPQVLRVVRPLAADRTLIEAWALAPKGAPKSLLERSLSYNRLVYSPMSPVAHDDIHIFESIQRALRARGNPWVSLHRLHALEEQADANAECSATSEILMRNQFRAWARAMAIDRPDRSVT